MSSTRTPVAAWPIHRMFDGPDDARDHLNQQVHMAACGVGDSVGGSPTGDAGVTSTVDSTES
ncbi:hypothetical protein I553_9307 [Mycobacterium xenopi 4042]|uniref:Uncharacterized protein n=1 Tax=Mycobacterium xenopi 4042 TaxID=1299334 RepID=X8DYS3_MYCXE|nr:hypothetical protein I552_1363 [Mycobacterium xenopi 3993]EUA73151.1 hypothetical protein I553_9307 [Mycobacterium xenopi 4042]